VESNDVRVIHDTDARGFRNAWPWPSHPEIVALGDSLTFGYGVTRAEAWPSLVAGALRAQVVNLGLVGASAPQYLRVFEVFGAPLRPRLILVGVFARNDFWDASLFDQWRRSGVGGNYMEWRDSGRRGAPGDEGGDSFLAKGYATVVSSSVVRVVRQAWRHQFRPPLHYAFPDGNHVELLPDDFADKTAGARAGQPEFAIVVDALVTLQQEARAQDADLVVALLPSKEEVHLPLLGVPFRDPVQDLSRALRQQGVDHVDLAPLFRTRAASGRQLFFETDGHPNSKGYALIAEGLLQHLRAHYALGGAPATGAR
jgi:lysophospholipase L1-like esterase